MVLPKISTFVIASMVAAKIQSGRSFETIAQTHVETHMAGKEVEKPRRGHLSLAIEKPVERRNQSDKGRTSGKIVEHDEDKHDTRTLQRRGKGKKKGKKVKGGRPPKEYHPEPPYDTYPGHCEGYNELKAIIERYPEANFMPPPSGYVCMTFMDNAFQGTDINIRLHLDGIEPACGFQNFNDGSADTDSCSVQVKKAMSCMSKSPDLMTSFYNSNVFLNDNPWAYVKYTSLNEDSTKDRIFFEDGNDFSMADNQFHAVVIYDKLGSGIGCGLLNSYYGYPGNPYNGYP